MGLGDVKLSGVLGLAEGWFSWASWQVALVAPFLLAGLGALVALATGRVRLGSRLPFGPYLLAGTLFAVLLR